MRELKYLSPTSLKIYQQDKVQFYLQYLADSKCPREPQTEPMAVGSSFDAFVKNYLYEKLFGAGHDPRFDLQTLFEAQVIPERRDEAWEAGKYTFEKYKASGALVSILAELNTSITTPRFEFDLMGVVDHDLERKLGAVPFLGKPDLFYTTPSNARVMHDWKVNGYYSKSGVSPKQGYVRLMGDSKSSAAHKHAFPMRWKGITINQTMNLEMVDDEWAQQLAIYMWLCGEPVGTLDCAASIDQIVCRPDAGRYPNIRVAQHRCMISKGFQLTVYQAAQEAWAAITSGHYFQDMSLEDSKKRCESLDKFNKEVLNRPTETTLDDWHKQVTRPY